MSTTTESYWKPDCELGDNVVCGSNGRNYGNECDLNSFNSMYDEAVYKVNHDLIIHFIYV